MEQENYRFRIQAVGGSMKKEDRIRRLIPWFEDGRLWFPQTWWKVDSQGVGHDLIRDFIEEEYAAFPVSRHDDMLDALSRLLDITLRWPSKEPQALDLGMSTRW
jgi:phage terminase large subunit-like protein